MNEWISADGKLPHFGQRALCYTKFSGELVLCFDDDGRWRDLEDCLYDVLYWMPLPEPPMEDAKIDDEEIFKCEYGETAEKKEWLKPSDKLPEDVNPVLAMGWKNGTAYVTTARFVSSLGWSNYWTGDSMPVKCWMELPDLPTKEGI